MGPAANFAHTTRQGNKKKKKKKRGLFFPELDFFAKREKIEMPFGPNPRSWTFLYLGTSLQVKAAVENILGLNWACVGHARSMPEHLEGPMMCLSTPPDFQAETAIHT